MDDQSDNVKEALGKLRVEARTQSQEAAQRPAARRVRSVHPWTSKAMGLMGNLIALTIGVAITCVALGAMVHAARYLVNAWRAA